MANHFLQPEDAKLTAIHAKVTRKGTPRPGVGPITDKDTVAAYRVARMLHDCPHILFIAHEKHVASTQLLLQQQVTDKFSSIFTSHICSLKQAFP